jgi:hypothetical protein
VNAISPAFARYVEARRIDLACGGSFSVVATAAGRAVSRIEREVPNGGAREVVEVDLSSPGECLAVSRLFARIAEDAQEAVLRDNCLELPGLTTGGSA